jgi:isoleucyl-tRNA synthetase
MKANLPATEPAVIARWDAMDLYGQIRARRAGRTKYVLHDGPPYANGDIHIGHALNKVLKDFIVKSRGLAGFNAPYIPGWDCHGLPIELMVEKKLGKAGRGVEPKAFRAACRDYARRQVGLHREVRAGQIQGVFPVGHRTDGETIVLTSNFKLRTASLPGCAVSLVGSPKF